MTLHLGFYFFLTTVEDRIDIAVKYDYSKWVTCGHFYVASHYKELHCFEGLDSSVFIFILKLRKHGVLCNHVSKHKIMFIYFTIKLFYLHGIGKNKK